jgi:hypothetical protein
VTGFLIKKRGGFFGKACIGSYRRLASLPEFGNFYAMSEIIFEVVEDEMEGGYVATALGHAIVTEGGTLEELRSMVRDAVQCHFGDGSVGLMPKVIRLHFVRDEVLAA